MIDATAEEGDVTTRYYVTDVERVLEFDRDGRTTVVVQNINGYAMLKIRSTVEGDEPERYYGFDMALGRATELLGASPHNPPALEDAVDMGM